MVRIEDKSVCCGCSACSSICPHGAISMQADGLGFRYPSVDISLCVECGLCEQVCTFNSASDHMSDPLKSLAMRNKEEQSLMQSRSGAVFPELASWIIKSGGVVYGAGFDENFNVIHKRADDLISCNEFRGSKYVQSEIGDTFRSVRKDLKEGKTVLFTGTPCQCAGLKSYVPSVLMHNLYLVDIVCHGVPSPNVWRDNLKCQHSKLKAPISAVSFRDKQSYGWTAHKETYSSDSVKITDDTFTDLYFRHIIMRESCYTCPYASKSRVSDLTLADFWGWQNVLPDFNKDDKGVSLVIISSEKGMQLIDSVTDRFESYSVRLEDCMQPNLKSPSVPSPYSEAAQKAYVDKGYLYLVRHYGSGSLRNRIKSIYLKLRKSLRRLLGL